MYWDTCLSSRDLISWPPVQKAGDPFRSYLIFNFELSKLQTIIISCFIFTHSLYDRCTEHSTCLHITHRSPSDETSLQLCCLCGRNTDCYFLQTQVYLLDSILSSLVCHSRQSHAPRIIHCRFLLIVLGQLAQTILYTSTSYVLYSVFLWIIPVSFCHILN